MHLANIKYLHTQMLFNKSSHMKLLDTGTIKNQYFKQLAKTTENDLLINFYIKTKKQQKAFICVKTWL